jgi:carotenoid cleavage dioxygenase
MRILGTVVESESGRPLEGLIVRAYDKDLVKDDYLGDTRTDAQGHFKLAYTEVQFRDLHETLPDLYLRIFDASGAKLLHTTEDAVRANALVEERFEIRIPRTKLSAGG